MPKINDIGKYPYDIDVSGSDYFIGTDSTTKKTKNFTLYSLAGYVGDFIGSSDADRVVSIGRITSSGNIITLSVANGGNVVYIDGEFFTKQTPNMFPFIPVTTGIKILIVYALGDSSVFYMAEGEESTEAIEPDLPSGALFIKRIVVTTDGVDIPDSTLADKANISGDNIISISNWRNNLNVFSKDEVNNKFNNSLSEYVTSLGNFSLTGNDLSISYTDESGTVTTRTQSLSSIGSTPATQAEVENQTPPTTENGKYITLFNIWKWHNALTYSILKPNSSSAIANRLRSDGSTLYYANNSATERRIAYFDEISSTKSVSSNITLDNSYHNSYVRITGNTTITIPTGLQSDFECYFIVVGNFTATFVNPSATVNAPFGKVLKQDLKCYLKSYSTNSFDLIGDLLIS